MEHKIDIENLIEKLSNSYFSKDFSACLKLIGQAKRIGKNSKNEDLRVSCEILESILINSTALDKCEMLILKTLNLLHTESLKQMHLNTPFEVDFCI